MQKYIVLLFLNSFSFLITFEVSAQNKESNYSTWQRDCQLAIGYPIYNNIFTSFRPGSFYTTSEKFISKYYPSIEFQYSHKLYRSFKYSFSLNYIKSKIVGSNFKIYQNFGSASDLYYNVYQIVTIKDMRFSVFIIKDIKINAIKLIRISTGFSFHIYPERNGDATFEVSNFYSDIQNSAITYFPELAVNKKSYRHSSFLIPSPEIKVDYFNNYNKLINYYLGLTFKYINLSEVSDFDQNGVFEGPFNTVYSVNYNFKHQVYFGIHCGIFYRSNSIKKGSPDGSSLR